MTTFNEDAMEYYLMKNPTTRGERIVFKAGDFALFFGIATHTYILNSLAKFGFFRALQFFGFLQVADLNCEDVRRKLLSPEEDHTREALGPNNALLNSVSFKSDGALNHHKYTV